MGDEGHTSGGEESGGLRAADGEGEDGDDDNEELEGFEGGGEGAVAR